MYSFNDMLIKKTFFIEHQFSDEEDEDEDENEEEDEEEEEMDEEEEGGMMMGTEAGAEDAAATGR